MHHRDDDSLRCGHGRIADTASDIILVGDSVGNVCPGRPRYASRQYGNDELSPGSSLSHKGPRARVWPTCRFSAFISVSIKQYALPEMSCSGCRRRKREGGAKRLGIMRFGDCDISVMGHLGLTPHSVDVMGLQGVGRTGAEALRLLDDAHRPGSRLPCSDPREHSGRARGTRNPCTDHAPPSELQPGQAAPARCSYSTTSLGWSKVRTKIRSRLRE